MLRVKSEIVSYNDARSKLNRRWNCQAGMAYLAAPSDLRTATWAAFFGSDANAEIAGDVAMLSEEITPVLRHCEAMVSTSWRFTIT
jgi:hypothetical protein